MRDVKMLEKLTMHDIQDVTKLFSPADKCAMAVLGMPRLLSKWGRVRSPKQALLPREVVARTKGRRRWSAVVTSH
jgi:hypothetical protein